MAALCGNTTPSTARVGSCSKGSSAPSRPGRQHTHHAQRATHARGRIEGKTRRNYERGGEKRKPQNNVSPVARLTTVRGTTLPTASCEQQWCRLQEQAGLNTTVVVILVSVLLLMLLLRQQQSLCTLQPLECFTTYASRMLSIPILNSYEYLSIRLCPYLISCWRTHGD